MIARRKGLFNVWQVSEDNMQSIKSVVEKYEGAVLKNNDGASIVFDDPYSKMKVLIINLSFGDYLIKEITFDSKSKSEFFGMSKEQFRNEFEVGS